MNHDVFAYAVPFPMLLYQQQCIDVDIEQGIEWGYPTRVSNEGIQRDNKVSSKVYQLWYPTSLSFTQDVAESIEPSIIPPFLSHSLLMTLLLHDYI